MVLSQFRLHARNHVVRQKRMDDFLSDFVFVVCTTYLVSSFPPSPKVFEIVMLLLLAVQPIFRLQRHCWLS